MKLLLTEQAASQIDDIHAYLLEHSPSGARNVLLALRMTFTRLTAFPELGRRQRAAGVRKISIERYPYNVYYLVDRERDELVIISVRHMSRAPRFRSD